MSEWGQNIPRRTLIGLLRLLMRARASLAASFLSVGLRCSVAASAGASPLSPYTPRLKQDPLRVSAAGQLAAAVRELARGRAVSRSWVQQARQLRGWWRWTLLV